MVKGNIQDYTFDNQQRRMLIHALYTSVLMRTPSETELDLWMVRFHDGHSFSKIITEFISCHEYKFINKTKGNYQPAIPLFVPLGHFYSPIVDITELDTSDLSQDEVLNGIELNRSEQLQLWQMFVPFLKEIPFSAQPGNMFRYHFENPSYSYADGSILYAMIRLFEPRRFIEIGSGWSSACTIDTITRYLKVGCDLTFIEPFPDLLNSAVGSLPERVRLIEKPVQKVNLKLFEELRKNDILFIDSTHVAKSGSDVCFELFRILPLLSPGVLIHIHDVFWPFEYPAQWVLKENRSWNETYMLRAFLSHNKNYKIMFWNDFFIRHFYSEVHRDYPNFLKNTGGALWLRKMG